MSDSNDKDKNFEGLGKLLDHNYDNIRELDNPLPGWWLVTFWATIIFAVGYYAYYELMGGPSSDQELQSALAEIKAKAGVTAEQTPGAQSEEVDYAALAANPEVLAMGRAQFAQKCLACHGSAGEGTIGPNLTDDYWIHGDGTAKSIHDVVNVGVLDKGMPAWGQMMSPQELQAVTAFVVTLHGTNPANGKAPQGNKIENN